ncbi:DUF4097 family beta strand repeat-containing protein [Nocardioides lianchengensis]|uniref:DUF4097 and DUF4098 domain-containing protein YvlB n=1 Tax=Nocardioides lianchengensis TaxID=1045774 RepID=A0A1G7ADZ5_9ACTN|nr:DUF4097 family beta strand repeat-containing protein [Nocardioides lianchengensis]NYG13620.1 DUF4097 and DUF4098 domain-containing protein YvlB [Nocardioides lianchengensis]SDE12903.1 DUF4097 and DUF4098 domain-containing protein YvlB [Nocardioides lianchengensis]
MSEHAEHTFETPEPVQLFVELGKGVVHVRATETATTQVRVQGREADQVRVEQHGRRITVVAPRQRSLFGGDPSLQVDVTVPETSDVAVRSGSADVLLDGPVGAGQLRSGSGDVRVASLGGPSLVETGSGDVRIDVADADLRVKSGSGEITLGHVAAALVVSTGSGDVTVDHAAGPTAVKTGSGDLQVRESSTEVTLSTGSGDLVVGTAHRGKVTVKGASGDVRVGVPDGVPVWTDITTVSGAIRSTIGGTGEPTEGQPYVELRAKTVSGDVVLVRA